MATTATKYVWGVKVYLPYALTTNADLGLYVTNFGAANTQFDITVADGVTTYTYDTTGTAPAFVANDLQIGDVIVINSSNFNSANNGTFTIQSVSATAFSVTNAGAAESNKTLGAVGAMKGAARFRWVQSAVTAAATWKDGILLADGIDDISSSADFGIGGNVAQIDGTGVRIIGSVDISGTVEPVWITIKDLSITLIGCRCEIIEFDQSTNPATETILYRGIIETAPQWSETEYKIDIVNQFYKRDVLIGKLINDTDYPYVKEDAKGEVLPVTFGEIRPLYDTDGNRLSRGLAKAIKVASDEGAWVASESAAISGLDPNSPNIYGVSAVAGGLQITLIVGYGPSPIIEATPFTVLTSELVGKYIYVIEGATGNQGQYRKIVSVDATSTSASATTGQTGVHVQITLNQYLKSSLSVDDPIKIIRLERQFIIDTWPLLALTDITGTAVTNGINYYVYDNGKFTQVPQYAYGLTAGYTNNSLSVAAEMLEDGPDSVNAFTILPPRAINYMTTAYAYGYNSSLTKIEDGLYRNGTAYLLALSSVVKPSLANTIDRDSTTSSDISYTVTSSTNSSVLSLIIEVWPPELSEDIDFDSAYLICKATVTDTTLAATNTQLLWGRFFEASPTAIVGGDAPARANTYFSSMLDGYFTDNPSTGNEDFFKANTGSTAPNRYYKGYYGFEIDNIDSHELYESIYKAILAVQHTLQAGQSGAMTASITEIAFAFKKSANIEDELFVPVKGRTYNNTWGARRDSSDLIVAPLDIIEHAARLSNWSEVGSQSVYGQAYSSNALINTASTEGGFDYIGLGWVNNIEAARQIADESEAMSGAITESICRQFFLCNYKNSSGQECINSVLASDASPTVAVDLGDIIPGTISQFQEVPVQDVFCEPVVRYAENYASEKFDGIIQITNAHKNTFSASYVSGLAGTDAEDAWELCHALYLRYKIITAPPDELTDHKWIRRKEDAVSYLWAWLEHMGAYFDENNVATVGNKRRFSFQVPYKTAMTVGATHTPWFVSMKFTLQLPHGTDNDTVQCMVEKISFNVNDFTATIDAICFDMDDAVEYNVKDSWDSYAAVGLDDWQDIVTTQAEAPTQGNDIQKTM